MNRSLWIHNETETRWEEDADAGFEVEVVKASDMREAIDFAEARREAMSRMHDEMQKQAERANRNADLLHEGGIIEIAVLNPNVKSYMDHWEKRAENAERERDELKKQIAHLCRDRDDALYGIRMKTEHIQHAIQERDDARAALREAIQFRDGGDKEDQEALMRWRKAAGLTERAGDGEDNHETGS